MRGTVVSIADGARGSNAGLRGSAGGGRHADWSLLEVSVAGGTPVPCGILLVDRASDELTLRLRPTGEIHELCGLEEQEADILDCLGEDLRQKAGEAGGAALLDFFEQSLSGFLRISDRTAITFAGSAERAAERLYDSFVDAVIRPFETHLPLYGLRAAATKFGDSQATGEETGEEEAWVRVRSGPAGKRLTAGMFVARVVGRSMEPLIPDDSFCIFRAGVTGSRQGRYLLIEKFGESDFASRYTVKRYTSRKSAEAEEGSWEHTRIRLEPLNREFEAFELGPEQFRVVAEFVEVLGPASEE